MILISILIFIVAMALPFFNRQVSPVLVTRLATIVLIYSGALAFNAFYIQSIGSGIGLYSGLFQVTTITQHLDIFLLIIGGLILIPRPSLIEQSTSSTPHSASFSLSSSQIQLTRMPVSEIASGLGAKYSLIILFSTLGSLLLISSSDLLSMYLSIELQSFGVYILATLFRDSKLATSAGLKYFLLGGLSSCLILLGAALVYSYTGLSHLESIYSLISVSSSSNSTISQGLSLGIILIIIGFLFKIAAAPLHNWAPDVYDDSPTIVTIWLTIMPKISILIFLLDLFIGSSIPLASSHYVVEGEGVSQLINGDLFKNLLLLSSLLSLIIGSVVGLAQSRIKRLLAYSTISHIGFILLALSINSEQSIESFIFYIIQYSITNLNAFLIILALGYYIKNSANAKSNIEKNIEESDIRFISEIKGQFASHPLLSIGLTLCLFSMAGTPPLMGFFSKQMVLYSAIQSGYYFISIIAILVSVISASYYLKIVRTLFSVEDHSNKENNQSESLLSVEGSVVKESRQVEYSVSSVHSYLISVLSLFILLFILKPSILLNSSQLLSLSLFQC
uniref:NADH-ubiquinone oxidoreductase chain 2 n=1 Tax=Schizopora paradoxa TaxID=27342 RepID=A0A5B9RDG5_9AGAM|nr:NADH dehydrogenase subunit 2 [Schizopora paradoxa]QEG57220.1 NADH dehydrogenase subunit 2 [Schizopora paradoxa]